MLKPPERERGWVVSGRVVVEESHHEGVRVCVMWVCVRVGLSPFSIVGILALGFLEFRSPVEQRRRTTRKSERGRGGGRGGCAWVKAERRSVVRADEATGRSTTVDQESLCGAVVTTFDA